MIIQLPCVFRENVRAELHRVLGLPTSSEDKRVINMEIGMYNRTILTAEKKRIIKKWSNCFFAELYIEKVRSVLWNLQTTPALRARLLAGELDPSRVAFLSHQEMNPPLWCEIVEEKRKRDLAKSNTCLEASTDKFTCKRCKSKKCTYYEMQTRSADEPVTVFITCLDCDKKWKI